jgi:hypothetical protein
MLKTTRRDLLKSAIATSFVLEGCKRTVGPTPVPPTTSQKLVVVFHGAFAFSFDPAKPEAERLTVVAPYVVPHLYKAGDYRHEQTLDGSYSLLGAYTGNGGNPCASLFAVVQRHNTGDPGPGKIKIRMPWPDKFRGLRNIPAGGTEFFQPGDTRKNNHVLPAQMPLVYVATYLQSSHPRLVGDNSKAGLWEFDGKNLHIFAEPDHDPGDSHTSDALDQLDALFSPALDLKINNLSDYPGTEDDPDHEVPNDEQWGLAEAGRHAGLVEDFLHIHSCGALLVTP